MESLLRLVNENTFAADNINVDKKLKTYKNRIQNNVKQLQDLDYLFMDNNEFELQTVVRNLLDLHPICEETLFSSRTGQLVITPLTIDYTIRMAKDAADENIEELEEVLTLTNDILEIEKMIEFLMYIKNIKQSLTPFSYKLTFDSNTGLLVSRERGVRAYIVIPMIQQKIVINNKKVKKYSFNEIYLRVIADKLGISEQEFNEHKNNNEGLITDMTFEDEVKFIPLFIDEHIENERIESLTQLIYDRDTSIEVKPLLSFEVLQMGKKLVGDYARKNILTDTTKVLSMNSYEIIVEA